MKKRVKQVVTIFLLGAAISACERNFDDPVADRNNYQRGSADFSTYVSLGDSLTAGYADRALYKAGQENSYPAILAKQFATVGGGNFNQPLVNDNLGGMLIGGDTVPELGNRLVLNAAPKNPPENLDPIGPEQIEGRPTTEVNNVLSGTFNNMGVPSAKSFHLFVPNYGDVAGIAGGSANPYFVRFASSATTTILADALIQVPTFFTLWIGNNDVLSYATSGGIGVDQLNNTDPSTYGSNDLTDPIAFASIYTNIVNAINSANPDAKGVLMNIPDVRTIPFFTTVPYNAVPLPQSTADALNNAYAAYNGGLGSVLASSGITQEEHDKRLINFTAGQNAVLILDEDLTDLTTVNASLLSMRQATSADLLLLSTGSKIGTLADPEDSNSAWGIGSALTDGDVLIPSEILALETARLAFNATIEAAANASDNLLFVDVAAILKELKTTGIDYGTGLIDAVYAKGGGFSLDGVHPTARAYAVVANRIIDKINLGFDANVPNVDPGTYTTIFIK